MKNNSAKYAFFYMLSLVSLGFMAISTGIIVFQIIDINIKDPLVNIPNSFYHEALRFAISALIISTPIYYLVMRIINKNLESGDLEKDSGVRRWLTYLIMFVASVVVIGYLIGILNTFLSGEITLRFALKGLTAICISAIIFGYYFYDIKRENIKGVKDAVIRIFAISTLVLILISFIGALLSVESPKEARMRKMDDRLENNIYTIKHSIERYYNNKEELPQNLELLVETDFIYDEDGILDPTTKEEIEYNIKSDKEYDL